MSGSSIFSPSSSLARQRSCDSRVDPSHQSWFSSTTYIYSSSFSQDVAPRSSPRYNVLLRRPSTTTSLSILHSSLHRSPFLPPTTMPLSVSHPRGEGAIGRPYRAHVTRERLMSARALSFPRRGIGTVLAALTSSSSIGVRRRKIRAVSSLHSSAAISRLSSLSRR